MLHNVPLLRKGVPELPSLSTNRLFTAATSSEWASILQEEAALHDTGSRINYNDNCSGSFADYVVLEGYGLNIAQDQRNDCLNEMTLASYHETLISWYQSFVESKSEGSSDQLCLTLLWHWIYMCLLVDFDQLERAVGRDGPEVAAAAIEYVMHWISTPNSTRCVLHAFLLQRKLQSLAFDTVPAIHVPRALFSAALAWYCYLQYGPAEDVVPPVPTSIRTLFPEFDVLGPPAHKHLDDITQHPWKHGKMSAVKALTLCGLGDSLSRIGYWGIAVSFARIVACLIYGGPQEGIAE